MSAPRKPKQSREELRALLLDSGRAILREEGLGSGAEALTFKRVFDRVAKETGLRLTNASIIKRVWENQAEYQADVLVAIATDDGHVELDRTVEALLPFFEEMDVSTAEARWRSASELCRLAGGANADALRTSANWTSWIGVWALATAGDPYVYRGRIEAALVEGYELFTKQLEEIYAGMADLLGMRLREQLTMRQFTISVEGLAEGCALRNRVDHSDMDGILRPTGLHGELQEWTLFAVGLEGLVRQFFDLDPRWSPGAAPAGRHRHTAGEPDTRGRFAGGGPPGADDDLAAGRWVVTWRNRRTLRLVRADGRRWRRPLTVPRHRAADERRLRREGLDPAEVDRAWRWSSARWRPVVHAPGPG